MLVPPVLLVGNSVDAATAGAGATSVAAALGQVVALVVPLLVVG